MICRHDRKVMPINHTYSPFLISVFTTMEAPRISTTLPTVTHERTKRNEIGSQHEKEYLQ